MPNSFAIVTIGDWPRSARGSAKKLGPIAAGRRRGRSVLTPAIELQFIRPSWAFAVWQPAPRAIGWMKQALPRDIHHSSLVDLKGRSQPTAANRRSGLPIRSVGNHVAESSVCTMLGLDLDCSIIPRRRVEHERSWAARFGSPLADRPWLPRELPFTLMILLLGTYTACQSRQQGARLTESFGRTWNQ